MFKRIIDYLQGQPEESAYTGEIDTAYETTLAVCALLIEMAAIDGEFSDVERDRIVTVLKTEFHLSEGDLQKLFDHAAAEARTSTGHWQFTSLISEHYAREDKVRVVELLWRVIYADGTVEKHEEYLVKKLARLIGVPHDQFIAAKIRMRK